MKVSRANDPLAIGTVLRSEPRVWPMLLWKEWCEHRWKLASLVLVNLSLLVLTAPRNLRGLADGAMVVLYMLGVASAMFIALGSAAGERSRGTLPFVTATPLRLTRLAAVKLLAGALTAILPPLVGVLALVSFENIYQIFDERFVVRLGSQMIPFGLENYYAAHSLCLALVCLSAYLWTAALGVNASSEIRAAIIALLVMVAWGFLLVLAESIADRGAAAVLPSWLTELRAVGPLGFLLFDWSPWTNRLLLIPIGLAVLTHATLAARFVTRFGRVSAQRSSKVGFMRTASTYLAPPRATPLTAIVWKQARESAPVALAAIGGAIAFVLLIVVTNLLSHQGSLDVGSQLGIAAASAVAMLAFFGFMATVVIGIGVLYGDVQPGIETFWRSRPIRPSLWFWAKHLTGLAIILLLFGSPLGLLGAYLGTVAPSEWTAGFFVLLLAIGCAGYCLSVAWMAVTRHAVYASMLGYGSAAACMAYAEQGSPVVAAAIATIVAVAATLVAWLFVATDWGWRGE